MNQFKKRYQNKVMQEKREESQRIKSPEVQKQCEQIMDQVKKKSKQTLTAEELPF